MGKLGTSYFNDGKRKIDYILVYEKKRKTYQKDEIEEYLVNLRRKGIEMEVEQGLRYDQLVFVKLHAPDALLQEIANIHNVILSFENDRAIPRYTKKFLFFKNKLLRYPDDADPVFQRCTNVARGLQTEEFSTAERILLVNYLLVRTNFGGRIGEYGLRKLLRRKTLLDAYPLHDSDWHWTDKGHLTDRQLLAEFWANGKSWYRIQPIHVIYNYYGSEVAFRCAWLGHYNQMLIPMSILGVIVFLYSTMALIIGQYRVTEVCDSDIIMCPTCMTPKCTYKTLSNSCFFAKITFLFDNWTCVLFAILTSIWATCFVEFWKRREVNLMFQWNILGTSADIEIMPEFEEKTRYRRISPNTGAIEAYIPLTIKIFHYCVSTIVIFLMLLAVIVTTVIIVIIGKLIRLAMVESGVGFLINNLTLLSLICTATISTLFIRIYSPQFTKLALRLTKMENQRTLTEHYNSFIFKNYLLNSINTYLVLLYLALVKGKLFTNPGDLDQYIYNFGLLSEVCHPSGCVSQVTIQLGFLMVMKRTTMKLITHGKPYLKKVIKSLRRRNYNEEQSKSTLPQWEQEYELNPIGEFYFVGAMLERILQYGLLLFFVSTLPLLPLVALIGNVVELRVTAHNLLKNTRRPVPRRLSGLGAWNGIITATTFISVIINALIIAFTTEFMSRELYRMKNGNLEGYINSTLTEFAVSDFPDFIRGRLQNESNVTTCYFRGNRHKPDEEDKYEPNDDHYYLLAMCFCFVILFEHVLLIITGTLAYAIPDVPLIIKEYMAYEDQKLIDLKQRM